VGLAGRLLRTGDPAARFALAAAVVGPLLTPLDLLLTPFERRRLARAADPTRPILFVCGPPRSGTTIAALTLIRHLPVGYFANLTSLFPRSPLTARRLFGGRAPPDRRTTASFYGRTAGLTGPNDALYLWDRWLGADRTIVPRQLLPGAAEAMRRFFGAVDALEQRPLVTKNNALYAAAHLVAEVLPTARFLCLTRDPMTLGRSLLRAREEIHGTETEPYGLSDPAAPAGEDPVDSVARQVVFHERLIAAQQTRLDSSRFRVVSYESFCRAPGALAVGIAVDWLGLDEETARRARAIEPFRISERVRLSAALDAQLAAALDRFRVADRPAPASPPAAGPSVRPPAP
jgi:hypothetical protein